MTWVTRASVPIQPSAVAEVSAFLPLERFLPPPGGFRLLPFRFMRWSEAETLLVNDVGEFAFVTTEGFSRLLDRSLLPTEPTYLDLKSRHMVADRDVSIAIELLATKFRTKKSFLVGFTSLHMFVVTLRCDRLCRYCQASRAHASARGVDMSPETARRAVDVMFQSPAQALKVEFQGGEPLLNFGIVRLIVEYAETHRARSERSLEFVLATNLGHLSAEQLEFLHEHRILVSTSLDGPGPVHDFNRPGVEKHDDLVKKIAWVREVLGPDRVAALMTTSRRSLESPREIVREYARLGLRHLFLRSVSPFGVAVRTGEAHGYRSDEFTAFYREALDEVITVNREGTPLVEVFAQILLARILTPFATGYVDLQSPNGAGISAVVYDYDGRVYPSDEARMLAAMGDASLSLGDLASNTYEEIFTSEVLQALVSASVLEALPGCAECAFLPYCGGDPVRNYALGGDVVGHRPTSEFCKRNTAIIRHLLGLVRGDDDFVRDLLVGWAVQRSQPANLA